MKFSIKKKFIIIMMCINLLGSVFFGVYFYNKQKNTLMDSVDSKLEAVVYGAKNTLGNYHDKIKDGKSIKQGDYIKIVKRWDQMCKDLNLEYIWTILDDNGELHTTTGSSVDKSKTTGYYKFFQKPDKELGEESSKAIESGKRNVNVVKSIYGYIYTLSIPFKDIHGRTYTVNASMNMNFLEKELKSILLFTVLITVIIVIISTLIMYAFVCRLLQPIIKMQEAAEKLADGDLTVKIDVKSKDEIGMLADDFKKMVDNTKNLITDIYSISNTVANTSNNLSKSMNETKLGSDQISSTILNLAQASEDQAKSAQEADEMIVSLIEEIHYIDKNMKSLEIAIGKARECVNDGMDSINTQKEKMNDNKKSSEKVIHEVRTLSEKSKEIVKVINIITEIAKQTDLLALNASIEAARAGESGKGFVIVADEIRKLSDESAQAVKSIEKIVDKIQQSIGQVVEETNESGNIIKIEENAIINTGMNFTNILNSTNKVQDNITKVADASKKLDENSQKVGSTITDIANLIEENSSGIEEVSSSSEEETNAMEDVASSSEELAELANQLKSNVQKFKI